MVPLMLIVIIVATDDGVVFVAVDVVVVHIATDGVFLCIDI